MKKFKTEVAMIVTAEQYKKDLEQPLKKLGYEWVSRYRTGDKTGGLGKNYPYLYNSYNGCLGELGSRPLASLGSKVIVLTEYNPELYLALAARTKGKDWTVGEWLVYYGGPGKSPLFKCKLLEGFNSKEGKASLENKRLYRKATAEEIKEHLSSDTRLIDSFKGLAQALEQMKEKSRFPFQLSCVDAQRIIDEACISWKQKLATKWASDICLQIAITVSEESYINMRKACTPLQNDLFDSIFGEDEIEETYAEGDRFKIEDNDYMLSAVGPRMFILINQSTGMRRTDFIEVKNHNKITQREFEKIACSKNFKKL